MLTQQGVLSKKYTYFATPASTQWKSPIPNSTYKSENLHKGLDNVDKGQERIHPGEARAGLLVYYLLS